MTGLSPREPSVPDSLSNVTGTINNFPGLDPRQYQGYSIQGHMAWQQAEQQIPPCYGTILSVLEVIVDLDL